MGSCYMGRRGERREKKERRREEKGEGRKRLFQRSYFIPSHFVIYFYQVIRSVFSKPNAWLSLGVFKIYSAIF